MTELNPAYIFCFKYLYSRYEVIMKIFLFFIFRKYKIRLEYEMRYSRIEYDMWQDRDNNKVFEVRHSVFAYIYRAFWETSRRSSL